MRSSTGHHASGGESCEDASSASVSMARRARELRPALRVFFLSAYAKEPDIDPIREAWMMKPFRRHELLGCD
jgi:hypothetical protein